MNESGMNDLFILEKYSDTMFVLWTTPSKQKHLGDIIFDISAGWVYVLDEEEVNTGYFTSPFLRAIAGKLDDLNAELFKEIPEPVVTQC